MAFFGAVMGSLVIWRLEHAKKMTNFLSKEQVAEILRPAFEQGLFAESINIVTPEKRNESASVSYSILPDSQAMMDGLLGQYKPDYAAFVAIDATTGELLTLSSYSRVQPHLKNLALRATFPAASVFKVVTATAAIDNQKMSPNSVIPFNGRSHTLYKRNVNDTNENRWTRYMTLRQAFGSSINTVFAKLGLFYMNPETLQNYAERFNFNRPLRADVPVERGLATIPTERNDWAMAEVASGFTRESTMSPLQGALMAASIANDGIMMEPYVVSEIRSTAVNQGLLYRAEPRVLSTTMTPESAASLRDLMRTTISSGTSRKSFRQVHALRRYDERLELGGKTGHLTGTDPQGRCDWFVGYAIFKNHRVAVAALTINEQKWRVKSSYLAARYIEDYLRQFKNE